MQRKVSQICLLTSLLMGCSSSEESYSPSQKHQKGEYIYRRHYESLLAVPDPEPTSRRPYPWEESADSTFQKITKDFFRCKGNSLNPCKIVEQNGEVKRYYDCGGSDRHSLPLRDGKEFIYPVLIDLLNYIQTSTRKKVVITCGHRCPDHNTYVDPSRSNEYSKHMIGAEVSFYVQGMEHHPEQIIPIIQEYYKSSAPYKEDKDYTEFKRYDKQDTNVSTPPWYNKEIFIKLFLPKEGRDYDHRHPYPYLSIQVRHDKDTNERVIYTWIKANRNFHRW